MNVWAAHSKLDFAVDLRLHEALMLRVACTGRSMTVATRMPFQFAASPTDVPDLTLDT